MVKTRSSEAPAPAWRAPDGKTWLLEELGRRAFANCVTVDFMLDPQAAAVFERDLDPQRIIAAFELRTSHAFFRFHPAYPR